MGWDDEELDTQIFDKETTDEKTADNLAADLFFEDDDRTVANEPPPDILEQARPPGALVTPKPRPAPIKPPPLEEFAPTPPPLKRPQPPRRPTLAGMPAPNLRSSSFGRPPLAVPPPPPSLPPVPVGSPTAARLRKSGLNLPPVSLPPAILPPVPQSSPRMHAPMPQRPVYPPPPTAAPFGTGNFADELGNQRPKRGGVYAALVVVLVAAGAGGYWYHLTTNRPGRIELSTVPADATVLIDNAKVGDHSPVSLERPPGPYTLSVTRDGYVRSDQNVELKAGEPLPLSVTLEPSPDTGFELTSEPPGGLVWLDGAPIKGATGQQARTDFRAFRIAPGHHVLEIKGENRFKPWRQDVEVDPGAIRKVHAMLIPASGSPAGTKPSAAAHPEVAVAPPPPAPHVSSPPPSSPRVSSPPPAPHAPSPPPAAPEASAARHPGGGGAGPSGRRKKPREGGTDEGGATASADDGEKESAAPAASGGGDCTITVNSTPWSEVWIDGKNTTKHTPFVDYKIPCGKHRLAFKRSDMQIDYSENITVHPGEKFKQRYTLATDE